MMKIIILFGCLLSLALAFPVEDEHQRAARSDSNSSEETIFSLLSRLPPAQQLALLRELFPTLFPTPAAPTPAPAPAPAPAPTPAPAPAPAPTPAPAPAPAPTPAPAPAPAVTPAAK